MNTRRPSLLRGFTMIELLVTIAIIAVLAAVATPIFLSQQQKSSATTLRHDAATAAISVQSLILRMPPTGAGGARVTHTNGNLDITDLAQSSPYATRFNFSPGNTLDLNATGDSNVVRSQNVWCLAITNGTRTVYQGPAGALASCPLAGPPVVLNQGASGDTAAGTPSGSTGLIGSFYSGSNFNTHVLTRNDQTVNFNWGTGAPATGLPVDNFSIRWAGKVTAPETGTYTFTVTSDDGERLFVNGVTLVDKWINQGPTPWSGTINLTAGQTVPIVFEMYENGGGAAAILQWAIPSDATRVIIPASALSTD